MAVAKKQKTTLNPSQMQVKIEYDIPENMPTYFVTNMVIQRIEHEFKVSFFELRRPLLLTEEDKEKIRTLQSVKAICVSSVSVTPDRLQIFIEALQDQLNKYKTFIQSELDTLEKPGKTS